MSIWPWLLLAAPAALPATMTLLNVLTWSRLRPGVPPDGRLSVLVPARDEAANIEACVRAVFGSGHPVAEVIVYDDASTDETPHILSRLQAELPALRVVRGERLPEGWVGKPHACHQLSRRATGDLLVFLDADTRLLPGGLARLLGGLHDADVVTAVPRQEVGTFVERLVLPLLMLTYTSWFPLPLVRHSRDPRLCAANGQLLALRATTYRALGGFAAVAHEIVDDMAFCRRAKQRGARVLFADGFEVARCRMYRSAAALWAGFSKNLYEGIGGRPLALVAVTVLYGAAFLVPYVGVSVALLAGRADLLPAALVGVGLNVVLRALLAWRYRQPLEGVVLHPLGVVALLLIAFNSLRWSAAGALVWAGRTYAPRARREAA